MPNQIHLQSDCPIELTMRSSHLEQVTCLAKKASDSASGTPSPAEAKPVAGLDVSSHGKKSAIGSRRTALRA